MFWCICKQSSCCLLPPTYQLLPTTHAACNQMCTTTRTKSRAALLVLQVVLYEGRRLSRTYLYRGIFPSSCFRSYCNDHAKTKSHLGSHAVQIKLFLIFPFKFIGISLLLQKLVHCSSNMHKYKSGRLCYYLESFLCAACEGQLDDDDDQEEGPPPLKSSFSASLELFFWSTAS